MTKRQADQLELLRGYILGKIMGRISGLYTCYRWRRELKNVRGYLALTFPIPSVGSDQSEFESNYPEAAAFCRWLEELESL